jgi:predicted CoA-binding protein
MVPMPSIAVVGASADRSKFGNKCVRAYASRGYTVFPIHPRETSIEGFPAYPTLLHVPVPSLDLVSLYVPPAVGLLILDDLRAKTVGEVWLNPGADAPEVVAKARNLGLHVVVGCSIVAVGISPDELSDQ